MLFLSVGVVSCGVPVQSLCPAGIIPATSARLAQSWQGSPSNQMTPHQFARAECANYDQSIGACKGIGIKDDGSLFSFGRKPACVLANRSPCPYFEECVLPMGIDPANARNLVRIKERDGARYLYAQFSPTYSKHTGRICPACNERNLEPRRRLCYVCSDANRRATKRESDRKTRK